MTSMEQTPERPPRRNPAHRWYSAAVLLSVITGIYFLIPAIQDAREAARRSQCKGSLKQIGLALLNYHEMYGCFPPPYVADKTGRPMHSWRVLILPFIDQVALYNDYRFDEPWNGPHNSQLASRLGWSDGNIYHCPSDRKPGRADELMMTNYLAILGDGTAWNAEHPVAADDITDGPAATLLVVEVADSGIHWMEPRDLHVGQMAATVNARAGQGISSRHRGGAHAITADDMVYTLSDDLPATTIRGLITIRGGEDVSP